MSTSLDYIQTSNGLTHYDFGRIQSPDICRKIEDTCMNKANYERFKAIAFIAASVVLSLILGFSSLNFLAAQILTIYFFSSEAWKRSEHYSNMSVSASHRYIQLREKKNRSTVAYQ